MRTILKVSLAYTVSFGAVAIIIAIVAPYDPMVIRWFRDINSSHPVIANHYLIAFIASALQAALYGASVCATARVIPGVARFLSPIFFCTVLLILTAAFSQFPPALLLLPHIVSLAFLSSIFSSNAIMFGVFLAMFILILPSGRSTASQGSTEETVEVVVETAVEETLDTLSHVIGKLH